MLRWIMHVDMDAFFASIEQLDNPELRNKPVIVGGMSERSVVSTCSYEARKYGVHSAMSIVEARRLCPHGIYVPVRMRRYKEISEQIMQIFRAFAPAVQQLSIDEAFLDLTGTEGIYGSVSNAGRLVKKKIADDIGLTASVGIAPNKFLAKMASDLQKPDGLTVIEHASAKRFIAGFPVTKIFGIGKNAQAALLQYGISNIGQLAVADKMILEKVFGKNWQTYKMLANGEDHRPVVEYQEPKSIGRETTFQQDLFSFAQCRQELLALSEQTGYRLRNKGFCGHTVTLKVKYNNFKVITRSLTCENEIVYDEDIYVLAVKLLRNISLEKGIRLLGISISNLTADSGCLLNFAEEEKLRQRNTAVDALKKRFGENIIKRGSI